MDSFAQVTHGPGILFSPFIAYRLSPHQCCSGQTIQHLEALGYAQVLPHPKASDGWGMLCFVLQV